MINLKDIYFLLAIRDKDYRICKIQLHLLFTKLNIRIIFITLLVTGFLAYIGN
jgi:predicted DNA-binding transcriptional regulator